MKNFSEFSIKAGHPVPHFKTALGATYEISRQANNAVHMSMIEGIPKRLHEFGELVLQVCNTWITKIHWWFYSEVRISNFEFLQNVFGVSEQQQRGLFKERRTFLFEKAIVITKRKSDAHDRESYITKEIFLVSWNSFMKMCLSKTVCLLLWVCIYLSIIITVKWNLHWWRCWQWEEKYCNIWNGHRKQVYTEGKDLNNGHSSSPWPQKNFRNFCLEWPIVLLPISFSYNYLSCSFLCMSNFNLLLHYWVTV